MNRKHLIAELEELVESMKCDDNDNEHQIENLMWTIQGLKEGRYGN